MSEAEAIAHIKSADADGNMAIDFAEFGKLWEALHGAEEVNIQTKTPIILERQVCTF